MFNRKNLTILEKWWLEIDKKLFILYFIFLGFSILFIFTASTSVAERINVTPFFFLKRQMFYIILSIITLISISFLNDKMLSLSIIVGFVITVLLLFAVKFFGFNTKGSQRWIYIFNFSFQPSEIMKPFIIVLNSIILTSEKIERGKKFLFSALIYAIPAGLILTQPDFGMFILITAIYSLQLFLFGFKKKEFLIIIFGITASILFAYFSFPHISSRIEKFILGLRGNQQNNYQVMVATDAFNNSNIMGQGLLEGTVKNHIPDAHTDFIFPVIAEEFGFFVAALIIFLFFFITVRCFLKSLKETMVAFKKDSIILLSTLLFLQAFINIGVTMHLLPTKGMTLPFLSYGGSSLISTSIIFGYILLFTKTNFNRKQEVVILENF